MGLLLFTEKKKQNIDFFLNFLMSPVSKLPGHILIPALILLKNPLPLDPSTCDLDPLMSIFPVASIHGVQCLLT